ncbi:hypothetical protein [Thermodesulfovibrio hydrogeniphilus]
MNEGSVTYNGDNMNGTVKVKSRNMQMTQYMKGKWIGQCPK